MRTYIAVTSSSQQYVSGLMTCFEMERSDGDALYPRYDTQGYVAREEHARMFLGEPFDAMLLLDADMKHQKDALERLRSHGLDIVCGHYYKRKTSPMESAILELDEGWPLLPMFDPPREGLHEIGSGGWGIAFMSRKVIEDVAANMPNGDPLFSAGQVPWASPGETFGPDVRFYLIARKLGYKVWLDASVHSAHATTIWLDHGAYDALREDVELGKEMEDRFEERLRRYGMSAQAYRQRLRILEAYRKGFVKSTVNPVKKAHQDNPSPQSQADLANVSIQLYKIDGRLEEIRDWIVLAGKYPPIEYPEQLPVLGSVEKIQEALHDRKTPAGPGYEERVDKTRKAVYSNESQEFIDELSARGDPGADHPVVLPGGGDAGKGGPARKEPGQRKPNRRKPARV